MPTNEKGSQVTYQVEQEGDRKINEETKKHNKCPNVSNSIGHKIIKSH